jgi:intein/homing endonuclease
MIGFGVGYKQEGLVEVCKSRKANTNTEIIPMHAELAELRENTRISQSKITNKSNFNGVTNPSVDEAKLILDRIDGLLATKKTVVAWILNGTRYYMTDERKAHLRVFRKFLKRELAKQVCYIAIKGIEKVDYEGYVYDFQVKRHSNFVAEGIICRNAHKQS